MLNEAHENHVQPTQSCSCLDQSIAQMASWNRAWPSRHEDSVLPVILPARQLVIMIATGTQLHTWHGRRKERLPQVLTIADQAGCPDLTFTRGRRLQSELNQPD